MREKERNLRRERERERTAKTCIAARHFSTRIYFFFYFIIMTGKLTMTFSLVSLQRSWIGRGACHFSFSFLFLLGGGFLLL